MEQEIRSYLARLELDIRRSRFSRFTDQKNTPDVVAFIADCILNYIGDDLEKSFTIKDIWNSEYFIENVKHIFGKPTPRNIHAQHEYDKFIGQPCRLFFYSRILCSWKCRGGNIYKCRNKEILEYIAMNQFNAFKFLYIYLEKVMEDSGFMPKLIAFKQNNTKTGFLQLKTNFQKFIRGNTPINGNTEINRIFPKVLNIFAVQWAIKGTSRGRLSEQVFYFSDLLYNAVNWRDASEKDKRITRQEFDIKRQHGHGNFRTTQYHINKAKSIIKKIHQGTEIRDRYAVGDTTQIHHIFPSQDYPQFAAYVENLIQLTPTQHYSKAHPNNKTTEIDREYQIDLLVAKSITIEESLSKNEPYYDKARFIDMINECMGKNIPKTATFEEIRRSIR